MHCPACQQPVDEEADLCLGCGEPLSPAARGALPSARVPARGRGAPEAGSAAHGSGPPPVAAAPVRAFRRADEPDKIRCPGCGVPADADAERCRSCGVPLRRT